jgi:hypothetical protein
MAKKVKKKTAKKGKKRPAAKRSKKKGPAFRGSKKEALGYMDRLKKEYEQDQRGGRGSYFRIPTPKQQGGTTKTQLRVLQFEDGGEKYPFARNVQHWSIEPGNQRSNCQCSDDNNCPICELLDSEELPKKKADVMAPKVRFHANVIVRNDPEHEGEDTQQIADFSKTVKQQILSFIVDEEKAEQHDIGDPFDLKKGRDFIIKRERTGPLMMNVKDEVYVCRKSCPAFSSNMEEGEIVNLNEKIRNRVPSEEKYEELVEKIKESV